MIKILIVDDSHSTIDFMSYYLTEREFTVTAVHSAEEALELLDSSYRPDIITCDIRMPLMDGLEFARRLRKIDAFKNLPLIAVSNMAFAEDEVKSIAAGFTAHITKPLHPRHFPETIRSFLKEGSGG